MTGLYNLTIRILSAFILSSAKRKQFRLRHLKKTTNARILADKKSNQICIPNNRNITLYIDGKNNIVNISNKLDIKSKISINIIGDNNNIKIDDAFVRELFLSMGSPDDNRQINNSCFHFGNSYAWQINAVMMENNTKITIGNDCMISNGIEIRCTDDHTVIDLEGNVLNKAKDITIGNHVWICKDVLILKNSTIPDNCIVGAKSVVAKRFDTPNCAICGNPARIVKTGINWDGARPDMYNNKQSGPKTHAAVERE